MTLRLWLLAGTAIAFLSLGGIALWYRGQAISAEADRAAVEAERDQLRRDLSQAVTVNAENQETIDKMVAEGLRRDLIIKGMGDEIADINQELQDKTDQLTKAKDGDEDLRKYLDGFLPPAVRCLRDPKGCPAVSGGQN